MSEPQFFQTRMGKRFYGHTMPELARAVQRLSENLARLAVMVESEQEFRMGKEPEGPSDPRGAAEG